MKNIKNFRTILALGVAIVFFVFFSCDSYAEHSVSISTSGLETIDVVLSDGGVSIARIDLNVSATCKSGYNMFLSSTVNDNNLYLDGDADTSDSKPFFAVSDGLTSLIRSDNTWGYYSSEDSIPNSESVFLGVPTFGHFATIRTASETAELDEIDDSFSVYYGVNASENMTPGYYSMVKGDNGELGKIVYYATLSEDCFRYKVKYDPTGTNLGMPITGLGSVSEQYIAEGVTDTLAEVAFENPVIDGVTYYFKGWNTMQDGTGTFYEDGQSVTDLTLAGETIILYAQWDDCLSEEICYYGNHNGISGSMGHQHAASSSSVMLLAPNYSLPRHGFAGWSEDINAASKYSNGEDMVIYGPNQTINVGDLSEVGLHLFAVWLEPIGVLQTWDGCDGLEEGAMIALQDARDENAYAVSKLADGRCWMVENLRLESDDSVGEKALLSQGYNAGFTGLANAESVNFSDSSAPNSLYSTNGSTINTVYGNYIGSRFPRYNNENSLFINDRASDSGASIYGYGNYYTWPAAVANTTANYNMNAITDATSICPLGWRMPSGGNKDIELESDYWNLIVNGINNGVKPNNYSSFDRSYYSGTVEGVAISEILKHFPNNFVLSGYYSFDSAANRGSVGSYWTSVSSINAGSYSMNIRSNRVDPGTAYSSKYRGYSIRCLRDE